MTSPKTIEYRDYVIEKSDGIFKIKIPSTWRVTYGRVQPTESAGRYGERSSSDAFCVRIYETEKQQRAIFTGVKSFRDLSIELSIAEGSDEKGVPKWVSVEEGAELFAQQTIKALRE